MNMDKLTTVKCGWLTASAVGVLLAQGAVAADYEKQGQMQSQSQIPQFQQIDKDGDGQAQWQDIESELDQQLQQADMDRDKVMSQFDQDGDQSLNEQEYGSFQTALQSQAQGGQQTAQIPQFEQLDQDGDGQAQWQDIESELDQQLQQANMDQDQVMSQYDKDGSGSLDQQEYESFQTALQSQVQGSQQTAQAPDFQQIDQDGDGEANWQDIESELDQQLQQANMNQEQVMTQFDQDGSGSLNQQEYDSFQTALMAQTSGAVAASGSEEQQAQQEQQQAQQEQQPPTQQEQQTAEAQSIDSTLLTMPVDQVMDAEVVNSSGDSVGQVSRIVRDDATGNLALVVKSGGIMGLGGSSILVDLQEVSQTGEGQLLWDTMLSQDEIAEMPEFDQDQYTEISENEYSTLAEAQERG